MLSKNMRSQRPELQLNQLIEPENVLRLESGDLTTPVRSICTDSRRATPGSLFFALSGRRTDGSDHAEEAVMRGAVAVVSEKDLWIPRQSQLIQVRDARRALAEAARRFHGNPEKALDLVGITGTSGKTVVATLLRELLEDEPPCGLLGTIHYHLGARTLPSYRTTPEPADLYSMLGQMRDNGCRRCILEVSSHGIDQGRVADLAFTAIAFLNLSQQHLDYHGSMSAYFDTILKVFDGRNGPAPKHAIVNLDDPLSAELLARLPSSVEVVGFGKKGGSTLTPSEVACRPEGLSFKLNWGSEQYEVRANLMGRFNVENVLAALALGEVLGLDRRTLIERLEKTTQVRGRMETISEGQPYSVVVDYMHTPESYRSGLETLRELTSGRIIVVFGCGGNRDHRIRPVIAETVNSVADMAFATADNPRSEELEQIFADMQAGAQPSEKLLYVENRRHAIGMAIEMAQPGDMVLIAGKGHETYQEFDDSVTPFDDRSVAREVIRRHEGRGGNA
jgi:UDP-N-acetylmuramoyl-L-alanyl-D-glutamate--2,6-diaminopimelate ligase